MLGSNSEVYFSTESRFERKGIAWLYDFKNSFWIVHVFARDDIQSKDSALKTGYKPNRIDINSHYYLTVFSLPVTLQDGFFSPKFTLSPPILSRNSILTILHIIIKRVPDKYDGLSCIVDPSPANIIPLHAKKWSCLLRKDDQLFHPIRWPKDHL